MPKVTWQTGVYCWRNSVNGKVYVGGAYTSFDLRLREYRYRFKSGRCHNRHLQAAWNKYGEAAFSFEILERCRPTKVEERETYWIGHLRAAEKGHGYNICPTGRSRLGVAHTEETRAKMSKAKKGRPGPRIGAVLSQETKDKIAASKRGSTASEETKQKMSETRRGKKMSEAHRQAYIAGHWSKGPNVEEIAAKIRAARTGTSMSEETRKRISEVKKQRNAERRKSTQEE